MKEDRKPYLIESMENDRFTIFVKETKPYIELKQKNEQLNNVLFKLEEWLLDEKNQNYCDGWIVVSFDDLINELEKLKHEEK